MNYKLVECSNEARGISSLRQTPRGADNHSNWTRRGHEGVSYDTKPMKIINIDGVPLHILRQVMQTDWRWSRREIKAAAT